MADKLFCHGTEQKMGMVISGHILLQISAAITGSNRFGAASNSCVKKATAKFIQL